jgi:hypothetical protein
MTNESFRPSTSLAAPRLDAGGRVLALLRYVTPVLCVECLADITAVTLSMMRVTTSGLLEAGSLIVAPEHPCPLCQTHPALSARRAVTKRLRRLYDPNQLPELDGPVAA